MRSPPSSRGPSGIYVGPFTSPTERFIADGKKPAWSPDGRLLAIVEAAPGSGCTRIALYDVENGTRIRSITTPVERKGRCHKAAVGPDWSPDGRRIVYGGTGSRAADDARNYEIFVTDRRGARHRRLTRNAVNDEGPVWSPDGRSIAYAHQHGHRQDLYVMRRDGSDKRRLAKNATQPSWRPLASR